MSFFVVKGSEDGTQVSELKDEADLRNYIKDHGITNFRNGFGKDFNDRDPNYWDEHECLIIKGEVIVPRPKEVVKDWEF